jgi:hypothetical protein
MVFSTEEAIRSGYELVQAQPANLVELAVGDMEQSNGPAEVDAVHRIEERAGLLATVLSYALDPRTASALVDARR